MAEGGSGGLDAVGGFLDGVVVDAVLAGSVDEFAEELGHGVMEVSDQLCVDPVVSGFSWENEGSCHGLTSCFHAVHFP